MRYQQIHTQIWRDEKFQELPEPAQKLFLYYMTSPHSNILGVYILPEIYALNDLKWTKPRQKRAYSEHKKLLFGKNLVAFHDDLHLICVVNQLKYNPIRNENSAKSAIKVLESLPDSYIIQYLNIEPLTEPYHQRLAELIRGNNGYAIQKPLPYPLPLQKDVIRDGNVNNFVDNHEKEQTEKTVDNSTLKTETDEDIQKQIAESLELTDPDNNESVKDQEEDFTGIEPF